jgi:hypothetical protein
MNNTVFLLQYLEIYIVLLLQSFCNYTVFLCRIKKKCEIVLLIRNKIRIFAHCFTYEKNRNGKNTKLF